MSKNLVLERNGNIFIIKINSPATLNALTPSILSELGTVFETIDSDPEIRVVVITGCERSFVAGADINAMCNMTVAEGKLFGRLGADIFRKIALCRKPVIAAINGFALGGGCELALACDIRIASEKIRIGQPEVGLGITPGFSGTQRLARLIGVAKAKELIFSGRVVQAEEALNIGLVNKVVLHDQLMAETMCMAKAISSQAPLAVAYSKLAIDKGLDLSLDDGIEVETDLFSHCFETEDQKTGMAAFLQKKSPNFVGR